MSDSPQKMSDDRKAAIWFAGITVVMCGVLTLMGRVWWCEAGDWWPWSWDVWSRHCSQHLFDPYALSHIQHGIAFFMILTLVSGGRLSLHSRALISASLEAVWEIAENTSFIINRYREATVSLDYVGDSIANSVSDLVMCMLGVLLVKKTSWKVGLAAFVLLEIASVLWIRDSLLLNILMLTSPIDAVKAWQAGG